MNRNLATMSSLLTSVAFLAGCSGSGSSSSSSNHLSSGNSYVGTTEDLTSIRVGGTNVLLQLPDVNSPDFIFSSPADNTADNSADTGSSAEIESEQTEQPEITHETAICCGSFSFLRFGQVKKDDGSLFNFAHGTSLTPSENIPNSGVVSYTGRSINNFAAGDARFDVDFGSRKVTGTLSGGAGFGADISIDANISGNKFNGSAVRAITRADVQGAFFGPNAEEMGGVFKGGDMNGSFGARQ